MMCRPLKVAVLLARTGYSPNKICKVAESSFSLACTELLAKCSNVAAGSLTILSESRVSNTIPNVCEFERSVVKAEGSGHSSKISLGMTLFDIE